MSDAFVTDSDVNRAKSNLRVRTLAGRRARSAVALAKDRASVAAHASAFAAIHADDHPVAAYVPLRTEPGSLDLLHALCAAGHEVLVPVMLPDRDLGWTHWPEDGDLLTSDFIARANLLIVPALLVAKNGTRLGRGGGSYDRALARRSAGAITIALIFDDELVDVLPTDEWDVPVDAVTTPTAGVRWLGQRQPVDR